MDLGVALTIFLVTMLMLATSSWTQWKMDEDAPLDVDRTLPLPWAGYGSSAISLSALFGAYSATLLVLGIGAFIGVVLGVCSGLLLVGHYVSSRSPTRNSFQDILFSTRVFSDSTADNIFWLLLAVAQLGLALSELVLLRQVLHHGMGFTAIHALSATLGIALVCYLYCLLAGYQAVFRTDVLQYAVILLMGTLMLISVLRSHAAAFAIPSPSAVALIQQVPFGASYLSLGPKMRLLAEVPAGFALGLLPVVGAPDTWKRVTLLQQRLGTGSASFAMLLAAGLPVALISPLFFLVGDQASAGIFPIRALFSLAPEPARMILLLGMVSAFMSTFDSAQVSAVHLLLKAKPIIGRRAPNQRQRYHLLLGFTLLFLAVPVALGGSLLPNPYVVGVFMIGPVGILVAMLTPTFLLGRRISGTWIFSFGTVMLGLWIVVFAKYLASPGVKNNPAEAIVALGTGCGYFFLFLALAFFAAQEPEIEK